MTGSSAAFHDFEHTGWEKAAAQYDRHFGELTGQSIEPLLDAVGANPGVRLLDIASGPGHAAAAAARRGCSVIGIDFSSEMVALALRLHPAVEFRLGDAEQLDLPAHSMNGAVMNYGMLHLANPERAITEAFRVLEPGGRYAFTVWDVPERAIGFGIILQSIQMHGNMDVGLPAGPPFFRFSDPEESKRTLTAAGFMNVQTLQVSQIWRVESGEELITAFRTAAVRTAALLNQQTDSALKKIREEVVVAAERYRRGKSIDLPMPAVLTSALRPAT